MELPVTDARIAHAPKFNWRPDEYKGFQLDQYGWCAILIPEESSGRWSIEISRDEKVRAEVFGLSSLDAAKACAELLLAALNATEPEPVSDEALLREFAKGHRGEMLFSTRAALGRVLDRLEAKED